jgi:hypothetical protein
MTVLFIVLGFIFLAASVLAVELLRPEPVSEQGLADLNQALLPGRDYEQMVRLCDDSAFLPVDRGSLMRKSLKRLRGDFLAAWAVCRLLAPISQAADPAPRLFLGWLRFHWLFAAVWVKTHAGLRSQAVSEVIQLLAILGDLRRRAAGLMQLDAGAAANGSRTTRIRI